MFKQPIAMVTTLFLKKSQIGDLIGVQQLSTKAFYKHQRKELYAFSYVQPETRKAYHI